MTSMRSLILPGLLLVFFALSGCEESPPVVGGDVDAHGCRGSAGYAWCEATSKCERPWELAKAKGFDNEPAAFKKFCEKK